MQLIIIYGEDKYINNFPIEEQIGSVIYESATALMMNEFPSFLKKYGFKKKELMNILIHQLLEDHNPPYIYNTNSHIIIRPNKSSIDDVDFMVKHTKEHG